MWNYVKRYVHFAVLAAIFMFFEVLMDLLQPEIMSRIVDEGVLGIQNNGTGNLALVWTLGLKMIVLVIFGGFSGSMNNVFVHMTGQNIGNDMRKDCFRNIMTFSFPQMYVPSECKIWRNRCLRVPVHCRGSRILPLQSLSVGSVDVYSGAATPGAVMGSTGSGKTTLVNLIPRFYDVTGGAVLVDGVDVREYRQKALRDKIAYALQKSELFSVEIRENIA